jgi:PAS domain S-box-containing protein
MNSEGLGPTDSIEYLPPVVPVKLPIDASFADIDTTVDLPFSLRAELLNLDAWGEILTTYGRTMRVAVALTDTNGHVLGKCHNAQPVWILVHDGARDWSGCPFCISTGQPCTAVAESFKTGGVATAHDQAGLTHVAVPLVLGKQCLGAIIAGQVFDRYAEQLRLRRVARDFGISTQQLWSVARKQPPVSASILQASGDLLLSLGRAFLRQRYAAILETKLAQANGHFRLLVDGVRDHALFTVDPNGLVTSWNVGAERMFGHSEAEIIGQNFSCIFTPEDIQSRVPNKHLTEASRAGRVEDEGWRIRGNQKQFWASVNITSLAAVSGSVCGFVIIVQDVTERRKIAAALAETRQERARLQEQLLSHVSHELRTPLTAVYLFTTNVLDGLLGDLTPEQHEHLTLALDNVKQIQSMVNDLLDISRFEMDKLTIEPQHVSLVKLLADVLITCRANAASKHISLRSDVAPDFPFVWADPVRLRQILINLIDNGIKFTPDCGTITVASRHFAEDQGFLRLSVSDTGCGISPENCELVFERLSQVKSNAQASRRGLGLGLFISRDLVSRQGGRIWVESTPGQGSTFYITLPVFSLNKLFARIFTAPNMEAGFVTLIALDVIWVDGVAMLDILPEIRGVIQRCTHPSQDVLLPSLSDTGCIRTFFIVACTDANGSAVITTRINRELLNVGNALKVRPAISSTTLVVAAGQSKEEQISDVTSRIERLVQAHLEATNSHQS